MSLLEPRGAALLTLLAASLALVGVPAAARAHPHEPPPLWQVRDRVCAFLASKPGGAALEACAARIARAAVEQGIALQAGPVRATLQLWAERGQVALVQHVLASDGREHALAACEICSTVIHDALHGDPRSIARQPCGSGGILPVTDSTFLAAVRPGRDWQAPATGQEPANERFLPHVTERDHRVQHGVGLERIDADGDGSAETERLDQDGDGSFDCYRVDRDRDGVFEASFERAESGLWKIVFHDRLLQELRRARAAGKPGGATPAEESP